MKQRINKNVAGAPWVVWAPPMVPNGGPRVAPLRRPCSSMRSSGDGLIGGGGSGLPTVKGVAEEGLENCWRRHRLAADTLQAGLADLGLEMFVPDPKARSADSCLLPFSFLTFALKGAFVFYSSFQGWMIETVHGTVFAPPCACMKLPSKLIINH